MAYQAGITQILYASFDSPQLPPHPASACTTPNYPPPHVPLTQRRLNSLHSDRDLDTGLAPVPYLPGASTVHNRFRHQIYLLATP